MYKDFIVKQTSDFDSQFRPRTLVGNWYEERCNPQQTDNFHFYKQRKEGTVSDVPVLTKDNFQQTKGNWLNFQDHKPQKTFQTEYQNNYIKAEQQKRLSVLDPFVTKQSHFDKNADALDQYRQTWTKSKHVYDASRTAIGHRK